MGRSYFGGTGSLVGASFDIEDFDEDLGVRRSMIGFSLVDKKGNLKGDVTVGGNIGGRTGYYPNFPLFNELLFLSALVQYKECPTFNRMVTVNTFFIMKARNESQPTLLGLDIPDSVKDTVQLGVGIESKRRATFRNGFTKHGFFRKKVKNNPEDFRCSGQFFMAAEKYLLDSSKYRDLGIFLIEFSNEFSRSETATTDLFSLAKKDSNVKMMLNELKKLLAGLGALKKGKDDAGFNLRRLGIT